jgi:hypothetical protein
VDYLSLDRHRAAPGASPPLIRTTGARPTAAIQEGTVVRLPTVRLPKGRLPKGRLPKGLAGKVRLPQGSSLRKPAVLALVVVLLGGSAIFGLTADQMNRTPTGTTQDPALAEFDPVRASYESNLLAEEKLKLALGFYDQLRTNATRAGTGYNAKPDYDKMNQQLAEVQTAITDAEKAYNNAKASYDKAKQENASLRAKGQAPSKAQLQAEADLKAAVTYTEANSKRAKQFATVATQLKQEAGTVYAQASKQPGGLAAGQPGTSGGTDTGALLGGVVPDSGTTGQTPGANGTLTPNTGTQTPSAGGLTPSGSARQPATIGGGRSEADVNEERLEAQRKAIEANNEILRQQQAAAQELLAAQEAARNGAADAADAYPAWVLDPSKADERDATPDPKKPADKTPRPKPGKKQPKPKPQPKPDPAPEPEKPLSPEELFELRKQQLTATEAERKKLRDDPEVTAFVAQLKGFTKVLDDRVTLLMDAATPATVQLESAKTAEAAAVAALAAANDALAKAGQTPGADVAALQADVAAKTTARDQAVAARAAAEAAFNAVKAEMDNAKTQAAQAHELERPLPTLKDGDPLPATVDEALTAWVASLAERKKLFDSTTQSLADTEKARKALEDAIVAAEKLAADAAKDPSITNEQIQAAREDALLKEKGAKDAEASSLNVLRMTVDASDAAWLKGLAWAKLQTPATDTPVQAQVPAPVDTAAGTAPTPVAGTEAPAPAAG